MTVYHSVTLASKGHEGPFRMWFWNNLLVGAHLGSTGRTCCPFEQLPGAKLRASRGGGGVCLLASAQGCSEPRTVHRVRE